MSEQIKALEPRPTRFGWLSAGLAIGVGAGLALSGLEGPAVNIFSASHHEPGKEKKTMSPQPNAQDLAQLEAKKTLVVDFYNRGLGSKNFDAAQSYLAPAYIQHNPMAQDGAEGLKAFIGFLAQRYPHYQLDIKRVFAEGDYVILHVHGVFEPGSRGKAIIDIFRLENGKIAEHWDVVQDIPDKPANPNGMF
jgi:predicted SnoaL-like aldol condensation-catalyzing enzyme